MLHKKKYRISSIASRLIYFSYIDGWWLISSSFQHHNSNTCFSFSDIHNITAILSCSFQKPPNWILRTQNTRPHALHQARHLQTPPLLIFLTSFLLSQQSIFNSTKKNPWYHTFQIRKPPPKNRCFFLPINKLIFSLFLSLIITQFFNTHLDRSL